MLKKDGSEVSTARGAGLGGGLKDIDGSRYAAVRFARLRETSKMAKKMAKPVANGPIQSLIPKYIG